jgi:hypothetical protein
MQKTCTWRFDASWSVVSHTVHAMRPKQHVPWVSVVLRVRAGCTRVSSCRHKDAVHGMLLDVCSGSSACNGA